MFTSWQYVRPGEFAWVDEHGQGVSVVGNQGPTEARFKRGHHPFGIRLAARPALREGPVLRREDLPPGTAGGVVITTLLQEADVYKAWGFEAVGRDKQSVYLESTDGRSWTRPEVRFEVDGDPGASLNLGEGTVFIDPSAPPDERYKLITLESFGDEAFEAFKRRSPDRWEPLARREDVGAVFYIAGLVSADGLRWRRLPGPLSVEHSDTQIVGYYDTRLGRYVVYTRWWMIEPRSTATRSAGTPFYNVGRRSIGRSESTDFRSFPLSRPVLVPSPEMQPCDVLYTNCRTTVPGAPHCHLMFPTVWHQGDDSTTVVLASSHDGQVWSFLPQREVFQTAPFGAWDGGCVFARPNLVELPDGSFVLPYTGYDVPHKYPRGQFRYATGYMVWPRGRLVALQADGLGEFSTVAFVAPGRRMLLNAEVLRAGSVRIEVATPEAGPVPGRSFAEADPLFGDLYRAPVTWQGQADLGVEPGTPIMLQFRLDRAALFAIDFE